MSAATPIRNAPLALWRIAEAFMHALCALFGNPDDVAAQHTFTTKPYALLLDWIRAGEAILRKLLLIEAAALGATTFAPPAPPTHRKRERKLIEFSADKPEAWRVSLRCFTSPTLRQTQRNAADSASVNLSLSKAERPDRRFHSAWPVAERYEALVRVFNNPAPYAHRLARRLQAHPQRAATLTRDPPRFEYTLNPVEREELDRATAFTLRRYEPG
jgi:hypothetical protein